MKKSAIPALLVLFHRRWSVPVLAELYRSGGSKFVSLVHSLQISRDSLRWTLATLIEAGWVMRNPGYGHPMRPEYILTGSGKRLAKHCQELMASVDGHGMAAVALKKWSMPVVFALSEAARFLDLKLKLLGITPRALALTLNDLSEIGVVEHKDSSYKLSGVGSGLAKKVEMVAQALSSEGED